MSDQSAPHPSHRDIREQDDHRHDPAGHAHHGHAHHGQSQDDHRHGHGHEHGPSGWARPKHQVVHLVKPHSDEAVDKVDTAMEASAEGMRTLWISLAILGVTTVVQALVFAVSGSVALLGDTIHNGADALTAVPLGIAFVVGRRAATRRFTYGFLKDAAREVFRRLMDAVDPALVDTAESALRQVAGVRDVGEVRMRWIGHQLRAEATVVIDGSLNLWSAHQVAVDAEHALLYAVPRLTAALIHPDPTRTGEEDPHAALAHHAAA